MLRHLILAAVPFVLLAGSANANEDSKVLVMNSLKDVTTLNTVATFDDTAVDADEDESVQLMRWFRRGFRRHWGHGYQRSFYRGNCGYNYGGCYRYNNCYSYGGCYPYNYCYQPYCWQTTYCCNPCHYWCY